MALEGYKSPFDEKDRERHEEAAKKQKEEQANEFRVDLNAYSSVKNVIGVVSGKGGVGKSMVTASLANLLAEMGYEVGIMDADITGPSIPGMYGLKGQTGADENGIYPMITENGIKVISLNLLLDNPRQAVVWRGPVIAGVVKQFWSDVVWGELDYLLIDMPPGTGDVPLTVFQSIPVDGIMIVTSPQELVSMIVGKALNMAQLMQIPVLGVVENFSYLICPDCGRKIELFGKSHAQEVANEAGIDLLARIPLDPAMSEKADDGTFWQVSCAELKDAVSRICRS
ncbi:MAG: Mrp/NBP35 family ATP-binding protein [Lachnospiraceae bacterium]|nr:Mrp/NBP35 family ATP-binding protein [Lachnospiraceae bacterium]